MSRTKLSKVRIGKGFVADAYEKANLKNDSGTQAVFSVLIGAKNPLGVKAIASRFSKSKAGISAFAKYSTTRFYKVGDTIELYALRRVRKLIPYALKPPDVTEPILKGNAKDGFSLTSAFDIAINRI